MNLPVPDRQELAIRTELAEKGRVECYSRKRCGGRGISVSTPKTADSSRTRSPPTKHDGMGVGGTYARQSFPFFPRVIRVAMATLNGLVQELTFSFFIPGHPGATRRRPVIRDMAGRLAGPIRVLA